MHRILAALWLVAFVLLATAAPPRSSLEARPADIGREPSLRGPPLDPLEKTKVIFMTNVSGDIDTMAIPLEEHAKDIVFTRMPERQMTERNFLELFTGQYELSGTTLTISLQGDKTLVASFPGRPDIELVPTRGTTFNLKGLSGVSIEFKKDAAGKVTEAVLYEPGSTSVVRKK